MSVTLQIPNYSGLNTKEISTLNADAAIGATSLTLLDNHGLVANDPLLIGTPGSETAEIVTVQSISGATGVTVSGTTLPHSQFDPVMTLRGASINIYRAPNVNGIQPADSTFVKQTTVAMNPDQPSTTYIDQAGTSDYWYKFTYYNATTLYETDLAASGAARGAEYGNYCTLDDIRIEAGFQNATFITDSMIDDQRQAAQAEINGALVGAFTVPFVAPINPFIKSITKRLAAGRLLVNQYGAYGNADTNSGLSKIRSVTNDQGTGDLDKLKSQSVTLTDTNGASIANGDNTSFKAWPDATTASTDGSSGGSYRNFRMSDVQNDKAGRKY